ncbi:MAG: hypothetical protein MUF42_11600 [Cytophagaceae bacterium]|jgi:uncharacterized protein YkwD|nr:hypothetical protein [Cytophagaceae bacterium]
MKTKFWWIFLIGFISTKLCAQSASDKIDLKSFKSSLLEQLIEEKIGKLRDSLGLYAIRRDSILTLAAKNHALFVRKTDNIESHLQPEPAYATLEKRVETFKGTQEKLDELIEKIHIDQPTRIYKQTETIKLLTYQDAADFFFQNNIASKEHLELFIKPEWYTWGISFAVNEERKYIYAVAVFGSKGFRFHHSVKHKDNRKQFYPSKKLNIDNAYGLTAFDEKKCTKCNERFSNIPDYITWGIVTEGNKIFFQFSDLTLFEKIFPDGDEALAVDIVHVEQFPCASGNSLHRSPVHDGILFKPLLKGDILKNNKRKDQNQIYTYLGDNPYNNPGEYELSLLLIKDNTLCKYLINTPKAEHKPNIIETDLFTDTLTKSEILKKKSLTFIIPFEKGKTEFNEEDIKPFYDSLNLNRFNIKDLNIVAYSSVEGTIEKNLELQKLRAQSIVNAIQAFQFDSIKTNIRTMENWAQFNRDIKNTSYAYLTTLEKNVVKEKLQSDSLLIALEPYLRKERKAVITLKVVEKIDLTQNRQDFINLLKAAIVKKDYANAPLLQTALFEAITGGELGIYALDAAPIPRTKEFAQMINNEIVFRYHQKFNMDYVKALEDASLLDPSNAFIKFNALSLTLKGWADSTIKVSNPDPIIKNIKALFSTKVDKKLVNQLYLNYYILVSDFYRKNNKYKYRDESLAQVKKYYKTIDASQNDVLGISNYFAYHGREDYAIEVLNPSIESGDFTEDMLFYFLSLTLADPDHYSKYHVVENMKKAREMNKARFCTLYGNGKIRFQLFKDESIKKYYCESCLIQN